MNNMSLAARIFVCPDCGGDLDGSLQCVSCGRSLAPQSDGIISALPASLSVPPQDKSRLQREIDTIGPATQGEKIVLFERAFHDEQASYYDKLFADPLPLAAYYRRLVNRDIYSFVRGRKVVVDLCCGTGKSSIGLLERGFFVVAIDVSREMLRVYAAKCKAKGHSNILLAHADASHPPLRSASCEAILLIGGLHHIPAQEACIARCADALVKGGVLIVHEPLKTGQRTKPAVLIENLYALMNPGRVWKAVARRLGGGKKGRPAEHPPAAEVDFTPYEKPFGSAEELISLMPPGMRRMEVRSQGVISFHPFPAYLQRRGASPLASGVVALDSLLARRIGRWPGDALFGVFSREEQRPAPTQG